MEIYQNQWNFIDSIGFLSGFPVNVPKFLIGAGYGGLLATRLMEQRPDHFQGGVVVNPLYAFTKEYGAFAIAMMRAKAFTQPHSIIEPPGQT